MDDGIVNNREVYKTVVMHNAVSHTLYFAPRKTAVLDFKRRCKFVAVFRDLYQSEHDTIDENEIGFNLFVSFTLGML